MSYDVRIWNVDSMWRASVDWNGDRLFGDGRTPALAVIDLGKLWERFIRDSDTKEGE